MALPSALQLPSVMDLTKQDTEHPVPFFAVPKEYVSYPLTMSPVLLTPKVPIAANLQVSPAASS